MEYEEFEWHILRMVYEKGLDRIQPSYVAYAMGIPHQKASEYLDRAAEAGVLELDVTEDGSLEYFVPGANRDDSMPDPIWREEKHEASDSSADDAERRDESAGQLPEADQEPASDGVGERTQLETTPEPEGRVAAAQQEPPDEAGADGSVASQRAAAPGGERANELPAPIETHVAEHEASTDGTLDPSRGGTRTVVDRDVSVDSTGTPEVVAALEESDHDLPIQIESTDETFSDPSQTIFMRQLRVEGVESEEALREHVHRLFDSLGYQMVEAEDQRMRFERGSVTFILALVPLFVLVLPLFVYLFLYCMGRSTIHQEPLELDVQLRESSDRDQAYDIDLTFIGLHGVVLGSADQRVLDKEVDTLQDELRWALTTG
jgi:hypothetical protein